MNKKTKLKLEMDERIKSHVPSDDSCSICRTHFTCQLSREAHMKLYPGHFKENTE